MKTKKLVIGILAHVDAGKTTLSESILYLSGTIRSLGRVDHKNAFLDTFALEKLRGITIFSKQAEFMLEDSLVTLLDTPGHVDFSAEMERTLQVLDYAILVINGMDGVQGHALTLWSLLKRYRIPTFIFINKMDQAGTDRVKLMEELQKKLDEGCLEFYEKEDAAFYENLALCDEEAMEKYLEVGALDKEDITKLIKSRKTFPCYFGSALKIEGVSEFLSGLYKYTQCSVYPEEFGAKVYKIARDAQETRLTYLKITGGSLKVKMPLSGTSKENENWREKVDQIRIYSGGSFKAVSEAEAGTICAVTGLNKTYAGEGIGIEKASEKAILEPVLVYSLTLPAECDVHGLYVKLCQLEEEEPQLHIVWNEQTNEIQAQVMGEVQIEILKSMILERFNTEVEFSAGSIVYKETIQEPVIGIGHFEPLRHYAEVHLLLEPGESGSGVKCATACNEDMLDRNWQRLILTHLQEKKHLGVLTGSEITDIKITVVAGRAHQKHTEGGDFRQATYRAVRQGLKRAENVLLEPYYEFRLEIPAEKVGRALADIQKMSGIFLPPHIDGEVAAIKGSAPVSKMRDYQTEVIAYTHGEGRIFCTLKGYAPCHNADEIIQAKEYDSEKDMENPTSSVFCAHGSGFLVEWDKVSDYKHVESSIEIGKMNVDENIPLPEDVPRNNEGGGRTDIINDKELEEIFIRTYGPIERRGFETRSAVNLKKEEKPYMYKKRKPVSEYLMVDGYNIIFAWEELKELAALDIAAARDKLIEILCNYQGYKKNTIILVFDAYKVEGYKRDVQKYHNIYIVYTKQAETADQYIERTVKEMDSKYNVTVATSDALVQMIIWGAGALRLSANELKQEIDAANTEIRREYLEKGKKLRNPILQKELLDYIAEED